ncbi:MAG: hypothetical protein M5R42_16695 [Rhodocyclaceae bacterium]|nr:hypothetical protein [Rhodocyclaceae bacterium]
MLYPKRGFNQVAIGERFESAMTMTETHIVMGAGLLRRLQPAACGRTLRQGIALRRPHRPRLPHQLAHRGIVRHGLPRHGHRLSGARLQVPQAGARRRHASPPSGKSPRSRRPKHDGGIVAMKATCSNQDGEVVAEATGTMLVKNA